MIIPTVKVGQSQDDYMDLVWEMTDKEFSLTDADQDTVARIELILTEALEESSRQFEPKVGSNKLNHLQLAAIVRILALTHWITTQLQNERIGGR